MSKFKRYKTVISPFVHWSLVFPVGLQDPAERGQSPTLFHCNNQIKIFFILFDQTKTKYFANVLRQFWKKKKVSSIVRLIKCCADNLDVFHMLFCSVVGKMQCMPAWRKSSTSSWKIALHYYAAFNKHHSLHFEVTDISREYNCKQLLS